MEGSGSQSTFSILHFSHIPAVKSSVSVRGERGLRISLLPGRRSFLFREKKSRTRFEIIGRPGVF